MSNNLISIVVPVYNVEKYLDRCIDSLIKQKYENIQIILVDDGSKDKSGLICDRWAEKDNRITVIHKVNGGLSDARNTGTKAAKGDYILFVDSDDYVDIDYASSLYKLKEDFKADIACTPLIYEYENGKAKSTSRFSDKCIDRVEAKTMVMRAKYSIGVTACSKLFPRQVLINNLFPVGKLHEDLAVMENIFDSFDSIAISSNASYHYVQRQTSITHKDVDFKSLFWAIKQVENQMAKDNSIEFRRACIYRIYDLVTEITRVIDPGKSRKSIIETQKKIRKYRKLYLSDPENNFKSKIKGFLIAGSYLSFCLFCKMNRIKNKVNS